MISTLIKFLNTKKLNIFSDEILNLKKNLVLRIKASLLPPFTLDNCEEKVMVLI